MSAARFTGFPDEAMAFYDQLEAENTKAWWTAHKDVYDRAVRAPMEALLDEIDEVTEGEFGDFTLFRPYRDVRFSADKTPYKTHQGAFGGPSMGLGHYLQLSADGLAVGGGFRAHSSAETARMRAAIDADASGRRLEAIVGSLTADGFDILGDRVKTAPRGFSADHPRIELLRAKELMVLKRFGAPDWLSTPAVRDHVIATWRALGDLTEWLDTHVAT